MIDYSCSSPTRKAHKSHLAEFQTGEVRKRSAEEALTSYQSASDIANDDLPPTHPIRLGLALNFSVFYYEVYMDSGIWEGRVFFSC